MSTDLDQQTWNPLPGQMPEELAADFAASSLQREIEQTNLVFYAFALFALGNLTVDLISDSSEFLVLNSFFLFVSLAAAAFMRRVLDQRWLKVIVNITGFLIFAALVMAKQLTTPDEWFIYFADILVIAAICLTIPISLILKLLYCVIILGLNLYALDASDFPVELAGGIALVLSATMVFSLIVYYKMQQAHFSAFLSLKKERALNDELRDAKFQIDELQQLLPVCANCKKVRDDNGYWEQIDEYIQQHLDVNVSHSVCPDCVHKLYPELDLRK